MKVNAIKTMKCKVTIDNGKPDGYFTALGKLTFGHGGFSVFYELDGDRCIFSYADGAIVQERLGDVNVTMRFKQGENTLCTLKNGGDSGDFPIYTSRIAIENDDRRAVAKISYVCAGENVNLKFTAQALAS